MELAGKKCVPCEGGTPPFTKDEAEKYLREVPGWSLVENHIEREYRFKSYLDGLNFTLSIGKLAEEENHHPDMLVRWRRVRVTLSTHAIKGLSENDFIMAAKSDREYAKYQPPQVTRQ